jgi:hypothetical protein
VRIVAALGVAMVVGLGVGGLSGCLRDDTRRQMAEQNSILAPLFKQTSPVEAAAWASDPHDADKRARGMNLLANAPFGGAEAYLNLYRERLEDESAPVRAVAARSLGLHGTPEDAARIAPLLSSEAIIVRLEAARALQRLHNPEAVGPLIERLSDAKEPEPSVRAEAAGALGQYAEGRVLQALIQALADASLLVNTAAYDSLRTLTGNDELAMDRKAWTRWAKDNTAPFAGRRAYVYPVFSRDKRWLDYVPFMPPVPNETASTPVGFTLDSASSEPRR